MTTKTCGWPRRFRRGENCVETLELDEVQEALALLQREGDDVFPVPDRAGLVKALEERQLHLIRETLHGHPELFVQLPDGRWWLTEEGIRVASGIPPGDDPPDGAA
jgi:hypothetical protein